MSKRGHQSKSLSMAADWTAFLRPITSAFGLSPSMMRCLHGRTTNCFGSGASGARSFGNLIWTEKVSGVRCRSDAFLQYEHGSSWSNDLEKQVRVRSTRYVHCVGLPRMKTVVPVQRTAWDISAISLDAPSWSSRKAAKYPTYLSSVINSRKCEAPRAIATATLDPLPFDLKNKTAPRKSREAATISGGSMDGASDLILRKPPLSHAANQLRTLYCRLYNRSSCRNRL